MYVGEVMTQVWLKSIKKYGQTLCQLQAHEKVHKEKTNKKTIKCF